MIRRPPRSTRVRSSAASDVYKRQGLALVEGEYSLETVVADNTARDGSTNTWSGSSRVTAMLPNNGFVVLDTTVTPELAAEGPVSYTHLRAHETVLDIVC